MPSASEKNAPQVALVCRVGPLLCALPLQHVQETLRPLPTEPLAGTPAFVRGVCVVRGEPLPVIDALALVSADGAAVPERIVVLKTGGRCVALAVGAIVGVRLLAAGSLDALPPLLRDASDGAIASLACLDGDLLLTLRSARLVPEPVWQALDAREARP
jgi:purine-binding chemotaxis protein CheW